MQTGTPKYLTLKTAAERCSLSVKTLRRAIVDGRLRAFTPEGVSSVLIAVGDLDAFVESNCVSGLNLDELLVDEVKAIAEGIEPHFRTLVLFIAATGLRVGEVAALRVRDFDVATKTIRVTKSLSSATSSRRNGSASGAKKPKTKSSIRRIDLSAKIVEILIEQVAGRSQDAHLFTSVSGHRFNPKNFARRDWSRARINANVPAHYTPHDLRHFAASQLLAVLPPENVYKYLGHASPRVTMSIYAHLIPERSQAVKEAVEQLPVI